METDRIEGVEEEKQPEQEQEQEEDEEEMEMEEEEEGSAVTISSPAAAPPAVAVFGTAAPPPEKTLFGQLPPAFGANAFTFGAAKTQSVVAVPAAVRCPAIATTNSVKL